MNPRTQRRTLLRAGLAALPLAAVAPAAHAAEPSGHLTAADVSCWTDAYLEAWRTKNDTAAVRLFTPDAVYEAVPGVAAQTFRGRDAIGRYWRDITAGQSEMTGRHGTPVVTGNRAAVELCVTLRAPAINPDGEHWVTFLETNILLFAPDGRCRRNTEYWNLQMGRLDPPQGWGAA
ncbi:nuclear transport factor 2 family protein [Streptomyces auratus]|uniref:Nuclear transport factor 2 family protein n=1 Tax=Streptomyces auratus AGR0001 TaxID=1160718 RepID=J2JTL0_9ACTN|nr:nuclear transport factor 2 family protein [Streptomyces auratus]QTZ90213.1 nuclear transport factor 2 family protein [Streptomyces auratus AGR0001]